MSNGPAPTSAQEARPSSLEVGVTKFSPGDKADSVGWGGISVRSRRHSTRNLPSETYGVRSDLGIFKAFAAVSRKTAVQGPGHDPLLCPSTQRERGLKRCLPNSPWGEGRGWGSVVVRRTWHGAEADHESRQGSFARGETASSATAETASESSLHRERDNVLPRSLHGGRDGINDCPVAPPEPLGHAAVIGPWRSQIHYPYGSFSTDPED